MLPCNVLQLKNWDEPTTGVRYSVAALRTLSDYSLLSFSIYYFRCIIPVLSDHTELGRLWNNVSVFYLSPSWFVFLSIQLWRRGPWFTSFLALLFSWRNSPIPGEQECLPGSSSVSGRCWGKAVLSQVSKCLVPASQSAPHYLITHISLTTLLPPPHRTVRILLRSLHSSSLQYALVTPDAGFLQSPGWKLPTRNPYSFGHEHYMFICCGPTPSVYSYYMETIFIPNRQMNMSFWNPYDN